MAQVSVRLGYSLSDEIELANALAKEVFEGSRIERRFSTIVILSPIPNTKTWWREQDYQIVATMFCSSLWIRFHVIIGKGKDCSDLLKAWADKFGIPKVDIIEISSGHLTDML